jgi:enoyl-CoA hydratase/carnithine racemase
MKQSLNELGDALLTNQTPQLMAALRQREAMCHASADFAEGRAAFADKRHPQFEGR